MSAIVYTGLYILIVQYIMYDVARSSCMCVCVCVCVLLADRYVVGHLLSSGSWCNRPSSSYMKE